MSVVRVDNRFRLTLTKDVRKVFQVDRGQKLYVIATSEVLVVRPLPEDPSERLAEILGDFEFNREARRRAEEWLLGKARQGST